MPLYKNKNKAHASKIIGLQFSLLSPDEIRRSSVAEITSRLTTGIIPGEGHAIFLDK